RALAHALQPFLRDAREQGFEQLLGAFEMRGERAIEAIEVPLVLHQAGPGQVVEILGARVSDPRFERFEQRQELGDRDRYAGFAQLEEEWDEHDRGAPRLNAPAGGAGTRVARTDARPARFSAARRTAAGSPSSDPGRAALPAGCPRRAAA